MMDFDLADMLLVYLADDRRPTPIRQLAARSGASRRDVEDALQRIAASGRYAVVADGRGYRLTDDPDELRAYTESLRRRLVTQYARIRALRRVEKVLRGYQQMRMFG